MLPGMPDHTSLYYYINREADRMVNDLFDSPDLKFFATIPARGKSHVYAEWPDGRRDPLHGKQTEGMRARRVLDEADLRDVCAVCKKQTRFYLSRRKQGSARRRTSGRISSADFADVE